VAVCTRNRPQVMRRCLQRLRDLQYPRLEILVVDNAPTDDSTQTLVREAALDDARVRYVREERPGLACARNRAVLEARGQLLAFTDDDVSVDSLWVHGLVRGLRRRPDVACITGLVASASIESVAEAYFDARVSWSAVQAPRTYDLRTGQSQDALFPYSPGIFGTGANLALRTDVIRELGGFDEALGAGTVTRGGEDLDIFIRVLREGYALVYEPSALVWHHHRADMEALSEQMYAYGTGFTALVAKLMANRSTRWELLRRVPTGLGRFRRAGQATSRSAPPGVRLPRALLLQELKGMAHGPLLYVQARRRIPPRANKAQP